MRASISILVSLLLPLALSATPFPSLDLLPNVTTLFDAPDVPLNVSILSPPDPYSITYGNLNIVFSKYGRPIPLSIFIAAYVRCLWQIWSVVAHSQNYYQPPEERPLDGPVFEYQNVFFHLRFRRASSAVVNWKYVQLYETLNALIEFAATYNMREMDVDVVAAGVEAFGGVVSYSGPPGASQ